MKVNCFAKRIALSAFLTFSAIASAFSQESDPDCSGFKDDVFRNPKAEFCEGSGEGSVDLKLTTGKASDYKIKWWYDENATGDTVDAMKLVDNLTASYFENRTAYESGTFLYQLVSKEAPYCAGKVQKFELTVNEVPDAPEDESIQYTVTGKMEVFGLEKFSQSLDSNYELLWYTTNNRTSEDDATGKANVTIDKTKATYDSGSIVYYIAYSNGSCYSKRAKVEIDVLAPPRPLVSDLDLCVNGTIDVNKGVRVDDGYDLVWFTYPGDTVGKGFSSAPNTADFSTPGVYTYYVAQRQKTEPYAQSGIADFTVTVYGVMEPIDNTAQKVYCANEVATELSAQMQVDNSKFLYADELVWVSGSMESNAVITPQTAVVATSKYSYQVYQTYTTPISGEVCKGDAIDIDIDVINVESPTGQLIVNYTQAQGASENGFDPILVQNPAVIDMYTETDYTLLWAKEATSIAWCEATMSSCDASKPKYNPLAEAGKPQTQHRYAKWQQEVVTGKFCYSDPVEVTITITSTPTPIVKDIDHCEGYTGDINAEIAAAAQPSSVNGKTDDFDLYWFDNAEDADKAASDPTLLTKTSPDSFVMPTFSYMDMKKTVTYYVVQSDKASGNSVVTTSPAASFNVTIHPSPRLTALAHDPHCLTEGPITLEMGKYWNVTNIDNFSAQFSNDKGATWEQIGTAIIKGGSYRVSAEYDLSSTETCREYIDLEIDIRSLEIKLDANSSTCPDGNVSTEVEVVFDYNKNGANAANTQLTWESTEMTSDVPSQEGTLSAESTGFTYTSGKFSGKAGDKHQIEISVTDGVCVAKAKQTVTIENTAVESILVDEEDSLVNVYTISGALIKTNVKKAEALKDLEPGAYIVGNKKVVVTK